MKEILRKIRKYEIKIRKAVTSNMQGDFRSLFKGSGLEFDDVRVYQYGDDVRNIDWNVSAKGHGTYVKTFKEEKDQSVFIYVDVSASQEIGHTGQQKIDIAKELAGVLALTAANLSSQVGLFGFTDQKELLIKPKKGKKHAIDIITQLYNLVPKSRKTNLAQGFKFLLGFIRRKSIIILISDFIDVNDYEDWLKTIGIKHDVIAIHLIDPTETNVPRLGIIPVIDQESKTTRWVNSSFGSISKTISKHIDKAENRVKTIASKAQIDYIQLDTQQDYTDQLIKLFKQRNKIWKRG